jgi:hypothetical protein
MNSVGTETPSIFVMIWAALALAFVKSHQGINVRVIDY